MSDSEELVFRGIDATECEGFIRSIRRVALSKERQHDNAWIALYASSCFAGGALRWYEKLDDDVQEDWKQLRVAMLEKWPEDDQEDEVTVDIVPPSYFPTPAAAAPPPSLPPLPPPPLPRQPPVSGDSTGGLSNAFGGLLVNRRYGVLAVETPQSKLYLYHKRNSSGCFPSSKSAESALRVEFDVGAPPHRIRVRYRWSRTWIYKVRPA
ncbi:hypothetical protein FRB90_002438 [Tulasnella sp. 427]|nr:hypothetical protein FRB90_002438 [Tulasnella sp. 427]